MMRRFLILFGICIVTLAGVATAQVYIKKDQENNQTYQKPEHKEEPTLQPKPMDLKALQDAPTIPEEKPQIAPAPSMTIKQHANAYFENCMRAENPMLKGEFKEMMCGCTSSKIPEVMTVEQYTAMAEDSAEGLHQRNRMMMFIYTPCIEYPTRALIMDSCPKLAALKHPKKTCGCIADGMADYMNEKAPQAIQEAIKRNKKDLDPLRHLLESTGYRQMEQYNLRKCIAMHEEKQGF